jgi:hypothetical protein
VLHGCANNYQRSSNQIYETPHVEEEKNDVQGRGSALVAWDKICRPKDQGGLGVLNLEVQNKGLLLKNLDKLYIN